MLNYFDLGVNDCREIKWMLEFFDKNKFEDFMIYGFSNINVGFSESAFVVMGRLFSKTGVPKKWLGWSPD